MVRVDWHRRASEVLYWASQAPSSKEESMLVEIAWFYTRLAEIERENTPPVRPIVIHQKHGR